MCNPNIQWRRALAVLLCAVASGAATAQNQSGETGSYGDRQQGHFGDPGNGYFGNPGTGHFGPPQRRDQPGEEPAGEDGEQRPAEDAPFLILDRSADEPATERRRN